VALETDRNEIKSAEDLIRFMEHVAHPKVGTDEPSNESTNEHESVKGVA